MTVLLQGTEFDFKHRVVTMIAGMLVSVFVALQCNDPLTGTTLWVKHPIFSLIALVSTLFGLLVRAAATGYLPVDIIADLKLHKGKLVSDGAFAVTRNPLYLGTFLVVASIGWVLNFWGLLFIIVFQAIQTLRIITYEEQELHKKFGADYTQYESARVPRLFPSSQSLVAFIDVLKQKTDWAYGIRNNMWFFGFPPCYILTYMTQSL